MKKQVQAFAIQTTIQRVDQFISDYSIRGNNDIVISGYSIDKEQARTWNDSVSAEKAMQRIVNNNQRNFKVVPVMVSKGQAVQFGERFK